MADEPAPCERCEARDPLTQLHPDVLVRVLHILRVQMPDVFARHRDIESRGDHKNNIGRQNLVEGLAHVSTLFKRAHELDRDKQLEQVAFIEDHFRRVMMESFELQTYELIGEIRDDRHGKSLERRYYRRAAPLMRVGRLPGHITPKEVEQKFLEIAEQCVSARGAKVADAGWDLWNAAADELKEAERKAKELKREMLAAVDAAGAFNRWALSFLLALILFGLHYLL